MSRLPSKVNLIPFNPFPGSNLERPKEEDLKKFYNYLYQKHVQVNIRQSRGTNILAACGQLAAE
jgi:23S rRNA (adenine2503-C2)-methyltransferase